MPVVVLVETVGNNRGRFLATSTEAAVEELSRHYPVGSSVAQKLARGETVSTDSYTLQIRTLETVPLKRQQALF